MESDPRKIKNIVNTEIVKSESVMPTPMEYAKYTLNQMDQMP